MVGKYFEGISESVLFSERNLTPTKQYDICVSRKESFPMNGHVNKIWQS
jgi:hypothetical protein